MFRGVESGPGCGWSAILLDMAHDVQLADRLRETLAGESELSEKRMFGGLAFLIGGRLVVAASGTAGGGLLLRADPDSIDTLLADPRLTRFVMRGRELSGWLHVDVDGTVAEDDLTRWVEYGVGYARTLTSKEG